MPKSNTHKCIAFAKNDECAKTQLVMLCFYLIRVFRFFAGIYFVSEFLKQGHFIHSWRNIVKRDKKGLSGTFALNKVEPIHRWFSYMEGHDWLGA